MKTLGKWTLLIGGLEGARICVAIPSNSLTRDFHAVWTMTGPYCYEGAPTTTDIFVTIIFLCFCIEISA